MNSLLDNLISFINVAGQRVGCTWVTIWMWSETPPILNKWHFLLFKTPQMYFYNWVLCASSKVFSLFFVAKTNWYKNWVYVLIIKYLYSTPFGVVVSLHSLTIGCTYGYSCLTASRFWFDIYILHPQLSHTSSLSSYTLAGTDTLNSAL